MTNALASGRPPIAPPTSPSGRITAHKDWDLPALQVWVSVVNDWICPQMLVLSSHNFNPPKEEPCQSQSDALILCAQVTQKERVSKEKTRSPQWSCVWKMLSSLLPANPNHCVSCYLQNSSMSDYRDRVLLPAAWCCLYLETLFFGNLNSVSFFICTLTFSLFCEQLILNWYSSIVQFRSHMLTFLCTVSGIDVRAHN